MKKIFSSFILAIVLISNSYAGSIKEDYELSERCKRSADEWFQREWGGKHISGDKDMTLTADYKCHYNRKLNKCFILLTTMSMPNNKKDKIIETAVLFDINENKEYGSYDKIQDESGYGNALNIENFNKVECTTKGAWDLLVKPYMEE
ncbi:MAG: hypothetical protein NTY36_14580 [Deltaproteobacteria bacterium]|nr:hypothetical protein [Deltaproteobacteria bacterium]